MITKVITNVVANVVTNNCNNHIQLCSIVITIAHNCTSNNHSNKNIYFKFKKLISLSIIS